MSDYSSLKAWHRDEIERVIKAIHLASTLASPAYDGYRAGHTAALAAFCVAAGIDAQRIGLLSEAISDPSSKSDDRGNVLDPVTANGDCYS